ncbi:anhydro-N-acetylmuramic acid kinase [Flavicella sp.]|uniref:anhydro-N-acetylmuramic acid kinase n=1 Tax=Flavicella sp. TaxID=2957742 RepID=UPI00262948E9|nr:anhydro-N-acetylmuramic acid kinase [Flavicella sp.]MDG1806032.1 anhydro-N-acetylmuramic acid kinase [Flavicella sp.]
MQKTIYGIGVMSGTSLDGMDVVYVKFENDGIYHYEIIYSETYAYPKNWLESLKTAFHKKPEDLKELDSLYGVYIGEVVNAFIKYFEIEKVDLIASHGHTIFHKPEEGFTMQIGCGKEIAKITNKKVVYDFRTQDVELGGQGAPLVPIGDKLLFSEYDFCLNLGGFANVSFEKNKQRIAFDICPVNIVMNYFTREIGKEFDDKGELASIGYINSKLLKRLNEDPFFKLNYPKSLGFEFVEKNVLPIIKEYNLETEDILRTYVEHVSIQIANIVGENKSSKTLVTGGGVYNDFLLERIRYHSTSTFVIPENKLVEFKEALIFAFLGLLRVEGKVNCLKSVTGANNDHSSGAICE